MFNFLKNCQAVFHRGCAILHSHQQCVRVPISPRSCHHLLLSVLSCFVFIIVILVGGKWYLLVVFFFFFSIYLFIFGCVRSWLPLAGPFVAACGLLSSCGVQAPEHMGSVVGARGLSRCGAWA